jgi:hypothetical protein
MKDTFDDINGCYGSHCGLTDLYPEHEAALREVLESGEDFKASWGAKKEIHYATVTREFGKIQVLCRADIDEIEDLADTCLWVAAGGNEVCDSGYDFILKHHNLDRHDPKDLEAADQIMEGVVSWIEDIYQESFYAEAALPSAATFEQVMSAVDSCGDTADSRANEAYEAMVEEVRAYLEIEKERVVK